MVVLLDDIEDYPKCYSYLKHSCDYHTLSNSKVDTIRKRLLKWYGVHRRLLPWRGDPPPYASNSLVDKKSYQIKGNKQVVGQKSISSFFSEKGGVKKTETEGKNDLEEFPITPKVGKKIEVTPYATWVSEVMCQQTRVETAIDYYLRWMEKFPTPQALAAATSEEVNSIWAGLGYYSRAKRLHEGAKELVASMDGKLPNNVEELKKIPGIGPYTSGAIASIAFNQVTPVVDGNVIRLFSRLLAIHSSPKDKKLVDECWKIGEQLIDPHHPGDFNQSLMELGATVCTPKNPQCHECPIQSVCRAYEEARTFSVVQDKTSWPQPSCNLCAPDPDTRCWPAPTQEVTKYPCKAKKTTQKDETIAVTVISRPYCSSYKYLLIKRPNTGLLANQWEFPCLKMCDGDKKINLEERRRKSLIFLKELLPSCEKDIIVDSQHELKKIVHIFSHRKHHMYINYIVASNAVNDDESMLKSVDYAWMDLVTMNQKGITTGMMKVLQLVQECQENLNNIYCKKRKREIVMN